ncbi:MAG: hypothetical protein K2J67_02070 [Lachnospiraceae bacterium]|nr:hypothetical protein [Lachnospiraceae bacterium]
MGNIISNSFQQAKDAAVNPDNSAGFFKTFKNSLLSNTGSNEDYERDNTGKIVTQENIDTYIPKLNEENREHKLDF